VRPRLTVLPGRVDPPFWWKPWLRVYWVKERWERRPVKPPRGRGTFVQPEVGLPPGWEPPSAALQPAETTAGPECEFYDCNFFHGNGDMPPGPEGALVYIPVAPGGMVFVREGGHIRLGPGAQIRALEGGGFTITAWEDAEAGLS